jgi:hypothetical protein
MKPTDYRNDTWNKVRENLAGRRLAVYAELSRLGPCTTRELAEQSGMDLLTIRPRVTELVQLGFAVLLPPSDPQKPGHEGTYEARTEEQALNTFLTRVAEAASGQLFLKIPV